MQQLRYGSVCSGIEAATVAWSPLGWEPAWFSEIEPFPSALLAHHYPAVANLGDMTALPDRIRSGEVEAPDVLCGGTPCQAFSVAGNRRSLDDARGNLSLTFCEIANAIDDIRHAAGQQPSIIFWENVPGVLSTKDNAFGCFLGELAGEGSELQPPGGKWSNAGCVFGPKRAIAWRVFDAQYFGVAQRRRRVFVVASARDGFDPAAVLFEFDGVRRDSAPSRESGKGFAADVAPSLVSSGRGTERVGEMRGQDPVVAVAFGGNNQSGPIDVATARNACASASGRMDFESETFLVQPVAFKSSQSGMRLSDTHATLDANNGSRRHNGVVAFDSRQDPVSSEHVFGALSSSSPQAQAVLQPESVFQDSEFGVQKYDSAGTLRAGRIPYHQMVLQPVTHQAQAVAIRTANTGANGHGISPGLAHTLDRAQGQAVAVSLRGRDGGGQPAARMTPAMQVRRLTPVECERLQGFPDNYTQIPWRKKPAEDCPDGPRYKALGNSWAVPNVRWVGARINAYLSFDPCEGLA